jgi:hypothetical protein
MKVVDGRTRFAASDVANFLACRHLIRLDHLAARGRLKPDKPFDVGFEMLVKRGEAHEAAVLARFRADGLDVVEIPQSTDAEAAVATRDALKAGSDVIYQGVLQADRSNGGSALLGRPDFLVRAAVMPQRNSSARGTPAGYEVVDAKLARTAKARAVLQSAFYSGLFEVSTKPRDRCYRTPEIQLLSRPRQLRLRLGGAVAWTAWRPRRRRPHKRHPPSPPRPERGRSGPAGWNLGDPGAQRRGAAAQHA